VGDNGDALHLQIVYNKKKMFSLECWDRTLCVLSGRLATASTKFAAGGPNLAICIGNDLEGTKSQIFLVEHAPSHP